MNKMLLGATTLLCMANTMAFADCTYPQAPEAIADAKSATQEQMVAAMTAFKQYNTNVDTYVACLDEETIAKAKEAGSAGAVLQIKALQAKKKTAATDERQVKIEAFNKAVREFKAKG